MKIPSQKPSSGKHGYGSTVIKLEEENLRRFATVVRDSNDAITIQDFNGNITAWNRGAELMYGYSEAEALAMNIERLTTPDKIEEQKDFVRRLLAGEAVTSFETQRVTNDGRVLDVWMTVTKLTDETGNPMGLASTERDITARKREEENLRRFATVVLDSNDAITIQDFNGNITAWNRGAELMYGYSEAEALAMNIERLTTPDKIEEQKDFVRRLLAGEAVTSFETQRVTNDGRVLDVWMTVTKLMDEAGNPMGLASTERDITGRKRKEEETLAILDTTIDGFYMVDGEGRILDVNSAYCRMIGYSRDELLKMAVRDLEIQETEEVIRRKLQQINEIGYLRFESQHRRKDGCVIDIDASCSSLKNDKNRTVVFIRDITARKREEENLRRFATVVLDSNDAITIQDFNGNITAWNRGAELMYGYSEAEALVTNINRLTTPAKVTEQQDFIHRLIAGEAVTSFETQRVTNDGRVLDVWMTVTKLTDEAGNPMGLASTERDITERKQAEAIVKTQRDLAITLSAMTTLDEGLCTCLQAALAVSGMDAGGIYLLDASSGALVLQCHRGLGADLIAVASRYDATSVQVQQVAAGKPIHASHRALVLELTAPELADNLRAMSIIPILQKGEIIGCLTAASRQFDTLPENNQAAIEEIVSQIGNVIGRLRAEENLLVMAMDLERQVEERTAEAERANSAKSIFVANMSHEIRTPLNAILGFAQLLERDPALTSRQAEYVRTINRSGDNLLSLINDILDLSKIETGRATLNNDAFDLHALLDDLELMFHSRAVAKGLQLLLEMDESVPRYVTADEGKLRQILINLLGNAVKFTETGGVAVRVRVETLGGATAEDKGVLRLVAEIEDTGPGIGDEDLVSIFTSYQQAKTGKSANGTGLGLAISRDLVDMMGGEITVISEVGVGSCFRFEVLLELAADVVKSEQPAAPRVVGLASGTGPVRILVVDDIVTNRILLCDLLQSVGFEVAEASNGVEALAVVDTWSPHAVLMDMRMPVMDGYEATRRLKASEASHTIPVIAVTASAFDDSRKLVMSAGVDAYLRKPFRTEELFATLGKCLNLRYLYAEKVDTISDRATTTPTLPAELVQAIRSAAADGDVARLMELITQVKVLDSVAAHELQVLVDRYDYELIDEWLKKGEPDHG